MFFKVTQKLTNNSGKIVEKNYRQEILKTQKSGHTARYLLARQS